MHPVILRKTACAAAVVLPLLFASCQRQSVEPKQPVVEPQKDSQAANPAVPVGTTGSDAVDAAAALEASPSTLEPATGSATATASAPDTAMPRDADAIKALEDMSNYLRTLKAIQVHATT